MNKRMHLLIVFMLLMPLVFSGCAPKRTDAAASEPQAPAPATAVTVSEFVLGPGDALDISVWRNDDLKTTTKIDPSGKIMMPLIGEVRAAGKSRAALTNELRDKLSKYLVDPQVTVSVSAVNSRKVLVLGEVRAPGVFTLDMDVSVMEAVGKAGGWTNDAKISNVLLVRNEAGKAEVRSLDMTRILDGSGAANNRHLQSNDIVYVPSKKIADISRFMSYIGNILSPIVTLEAGIVLWPQAIDALQGEKSGNIAIPTN